MRRLLFPALSVLLVAFLIGCGGGGTGVSLDDTAGSTDAGSSSGSVTGPMRAAAGTYSLSLAGTQTTGGSVTGTGTGTAFLDGSVNLTYSQVSGTTTNPRTLAASVTTAGVASGSITQGSTSLPFTGGSLVRNSNGTYTLVVSTVTGSGETAINETDTFTLTTVTPAAGAFTTVSSGTDTSGGTYSGTGAVNLASNGSFTLNYSSRRTASGAGITLAHSLTSSLLADGTFTGTMTLGSGTPSGSTTVNGTWVSNASGTVTLALVYANSSFIPTPTATETIVLTRSST